MCAFVRFLKIFDVRIFVRLLAKICAHLSLELLNTLMSSFSATMETRQNVEKFKVKSRNILAQETLRQNVSMDLPLQLNKKFNHMSYKSGKSLTVGGADFWSFEASWRLSEATEDSVILQIHSNQLDL